MATNAIGIVGLGYVGLPLAVAFAEAGRRSSASTPTRARSRALNAGRSHIEDITDATLAPLGERLRATSNPADLSACEAVVDLRADAADRLARARPHLPARRRPRRSSRSCEPGQLVVLESTTYPGTTRERLAADPRGVRDTRPARDFHLAFSPERIDPGRTDYTVRTTPKLVGGLTPACAERARELYARICDEVVVLSTPRRPSSRSCSRTSSARSTSPSSTSWRSSASGSASTSGR